MRLIVERDALAPALDALAKIAPRKSNIPILNHILVQANEAAMVLTAHALDHWMSITVPAEVALPGEASIQAETLRSVVKGIASGAQVTLSTTAERAEVRTGRSRYSLSILPAQDFPPLAWSFDAGSASIALNADEVRTLLDRPAFCASDDSTYSFLMGVFLHLKGRHLHGLAADRIKGYATSIPAPAGAEALPEQPGSGFRGVIVPTGAAEAIVRLSGLGCTLEVDANKIVARAPNACFGAKLIDGTFPDFWRAVPIRDKAPARIVADRAEMQAAITRLLAVADSDRQVVRLEWADGDEDLRLALSGQRGDGAESVPLYEPAAGSHRAEFAPGQIQAVLAASKSERVEYTRQPGTMTAWLADPADRETVSIVTGITPKHAEASDAAAA